MIDLRKLIGHNMTEQELILNYKGGDSKALDRLFKDNENLIWHIYNKYFKTSGCPKNDLFQEGCIGLITAIKRFDQEKAAQFKTYKILWIKKKMFDFRKSFFKNSLKTVELTDEHFAIAEPEKRSQKLKEMILELDNMVISGRVSKNKAQKTLKRIIGK